jgi:hypothetical protein
MQNDSNDDDILIGWAAMAAFGQSEGYRVTRSTITKRGSPAIGTGPELIGYYGHQPTSTKGRVRAWLKAQIRPDRPHSNRWLPKVTSAVEAA